MFLRTNDQFQINTPISKQKGEHDYQVIEVVAPVGLFHLEIWTNECVPIRFIMTDIRNVMQGLKDPKITKANIYYQSRLPQDGEYNIHKIKSVRVKDNVIHYTCSNGSKISEEFHLHTGGLEDLNCQF